MKPASRPSTAKTSTVPAPLATPAPTDPETAGSPSLFGRHLRAGWWSLLIFLTAGLALEALHGFKAGAYLSVANETRRLMWTLAHAHGTLLGLVNLGFAATLKGVPDWPAGPRRLASGSLLAATILMPAGFFMGGLFIHAGDPGLGIVLVPLGGLALFLAAFLTVRGLRHLPAEMDASNP